MPKTPWLLTVDGAVGDGVFVAFSAGQWTLAVGPCIARRAVEQNSIYLVRNCPFPLLTRRLFLGRAVALETDLVLFHPGSFLRNPGSFDFLNFLLKLSDSHL
jgi:hypothetical protein